MNHFDEVRFDEVRRIVMADSSLMQRLSAVSTEVDLFAEVIALGRANGIELTITELEGIVRANRIAWFQRWVP